MKKYLVVPLLIVFLFSVLMTSSVSAQTSCSSYVPGPGGTYICVPAVQPAAPAAATPSPVQSNTVTAPSGGFGTVVANPGDGAYALAVRCGVALGTFKTANGMVGENPVIQAYSTYNCGGSGTAATEYNVYNPATAPARSIADGATFTVTNEKLGLKWL